MRREAGKGPRVRGAKVGGVTGVRKGFLCRKTEERPWQPPAPRQSSAGGVRGGIRDAEVGRSGQALWSLLPEGSSISLLQGKKKEKRKKKKEREKDQTSAAPSLD